MTQTRSDKDVDVHKVAAVGGTISVTSASTQKLAIFFLALRLIPLAIVLTIECKCSFLLLEFQI